MPLKPRGTCDPHGLSCDQRYHTHWSWLGALNFSHSPSHLRLQMILSSSPAQKFPSLPLLRAFHPPRASTTVNVSHDRIRRALHTTLSPRSEQYFPLLPLR